MDDKDGLRYSNTSLSARTTTMKLMTTAQPRPYRTAVVFDIQSDCKSEYATTRLFTRGNRGRVQSLVSRRRHRTGYQQSIPGQDRSNQYQCSVGKGE